MKLILTDLQNPSLSVSGEYKIYKNDTEIHSCTGCFGCWTKTPGKCLIKDATNQFAEDLGKCTEFIIISRCLYGTVSPFVKKMQDRGIPHLLPFFLIRNKEMHHKIRYDNTFTLSAYFYGQDLSDDEKATAREVIMRNSLNLNAKIKEIQFFTDAKQIEEKSL